MLILIFFSSLQYLFSAVVSIDVNPSIAVVDGRTFTSHTARLHTADSIATLGNNIMVIYQDSKNNYWFGSWETGLYRYDGQRVQHFTTEDGLAGNRVETIHEDHKGNLYFNTAGGISQYDGQKFVTLKEAIGTGQEWALQPNDIWFKDPLYSSGRVCRYDGSRLYCMELPKVKIGEEWIIAKPNTYSPYAVYSLYKDNKGYMWFGTAALGVCRYNGISFDWITESDVNELHNGPSNGVRSIVQDADGYFWFNTEYRYDVKDQPDFRNAFYTREKSIGSLDGIDPSFTEYLSIAMDDQHHLWMATYGAGVYRYDGKRITHYPVQYDGRDITVFCIYKDNHGVLWLGTHEHGAFRFNGKVFEQFYP